jgi:hypothetical protein
MRAIVLFISLQALACSSDDDLSANGDRSRSDASVESDAGGSNGGNTGDGGCSRVELADFELSLEDDVSVRYGAAVTPRIAFTFSMLEILFERYSPEPDVGVFQLGGDRPDGNYGSCAHCVVIPGIAPEYAYFADRGTLRVEADPYRRRLKAKLQNVRLVEVDVSLETRSSMPVPNGKCIELDDVEVDAIFPREGWSCAPEKFSDGEHCDCECGASDPDCEVLDCAPDDSSCPAPLPVADCGATDVCRWGLQTMTTRCYETCAWGASSCSSGACLFDNGLYGAEVCGSGEDEVSAAMLGEQCAERPFMRPCAVSGGSALGYCDVDMRCRPVCENDTDCASEPGTTCYAFFTDRSFGYCALPQPEDG